MEKEKIQEIVNAMTTHEKVLLCTGKNSWRTRNLERLGVPSVLMSDGTSGVRFQYGSDQPQEMSFYDSLGGSFDNEDAMARTCEATCFPSGSAIACSWNTDLTARIGTALAEECKALGINILLGPGMNIHRHPLTARNFEYYSEDPVITGELASSIVNSIQSEGVGTCMKHFACHNSDSRRTRVNVTVSERALREIYLAGFERVIQKASPVSFMSAYNRINGEEASGNNRITRDIVRKEWGYDGTIVCDWGAVKDPVEATKGTIDLQMPLSKSSAKWLEEAVESGRLDEKLLDQRCGHILNLVFTLKEWEQNWDRSRKIGDHHALAVEAAAESMVLLKNEGRILPFKPERGDKVAIIGRFAKEPLYQGTGCAKVHARKVDIPYDSMMPFLTSCDVRYAEGYAADGSTTEEMLTSAQQAAEDASAVILFVGSFLPGEDDDYNRKDIRLPEGMVRLIGKVSDVNPNTVVVLSSGEVCEMPWRTGVKALLYTWFSGEGLGKAVADLLFGSVSPSGRLASTVPERIQDTPAFLSFEGNTYEIPYADDIYVGYRCYEKKGIRPAYPFGYGLSYSEFSYSHLRFLKHAPGATNGPESSTAQEEADGWTERLDMHPDQTGHSTISVEVDVKNEGPVEAMHVVELYIEPKMRTRLPRPVRELKAFAKVKLMPGETRTVRLELDRRDFSYYDPKAEDWVVENGTYAVEICSDCQTVDLSAEVIWSGESYLVPLAPDCGFYEMFQYPVVRHMFYDFLVGQGLVSKDQVNEKLEKGMVWSFWSVRTFLDMNSDGCITFEAYNDFLARANKAIAALKEK